MEFHSHNSGLGTIFTYLKMGNTRTRCVQWEWSTGGDGIEGTKQRVEGLRRGLERA